jgi:hypothetical protein
METFALSGASFHHKSKKVCTVILIDSLLLVLFGGVKSFNPLARTQQTYITGFFKKIYSVANLQ